MARQQGLPVKDALTANGHGQNYASQNSHKRQEKYLWDGLKDGKIHYKKMVPAPMGVLVPTFSHVMINYDDESVAPQFTAMNGESEVAGLASDVFCKQTIIKVDDIKALGGDGLKVSGGAYTLLPVPNKTMLERFTGCAEDDAEVQE